MSNNRTKVIVTLGPSTSREEDLRSIRDKGVDFVRINMSHSSIDDLRRFILLSKRVGIPFIIDTEGSQIRTGDLESGLVQFEEHDRVVVCADEIVGNRHQLCLKPGFVIAQLQVGDLIHVDFDTLILRVIDISTAAQGHVLTEAITGGSLGKNKAVVVVQGMERGFALPALSPKDYQSIELGLQEGIEYIAVSFVRSGRTVDEVRSVTGNRMKIISKVECIDALNSIDEIIRKSDFILIDRGDLSKEIPVEKVPFTQKIVIQKARRRKREVFVATNLLETMVEKRKPTRAEVHDVIATIMDGAAGLTLSAETAIGKYPMECINTLNRLIQHAEQTSAALPIPWRENRLVRALERMDYLSDADHAAGLVPPHGGKLVHRVLAEQPDPGYLRSLPRVELDLNQQMDMEQIALGTYSPLEGFMGHDDFQSVLADLRLTNGVVWPLPVVLDVPQAVADRLTVGQTVGLADRAGEVVGLLHLDEKCGFQAEQTAQSIYGALAEDHPGVRIVRRMNPVLLAGKVELIKRHHSETMAYQLTPRQVRRLFIERAWTRVLAFHTRNVIHRGHEYLQSKAMEAENCDGLLIHPVVGNKRAGEFNPRYVVKAYEQMIDSVYPKNKVVFATFATFSRYAGPREALFSALCRKNFGCSHFLVGHNHAGVGDYYPPRAAQEIFDQFPDIGIKPVKCDEVVYSTALSGYVQAPAGFCASTGETMNIRGSEARAMLGSGRMPPGWFMRPEIARMVLDAVNSGEEVFVTDGIAS